MVHDCYALTAHIKGKSSFCILECGGIQIQSGDVLLVRDGLAGSLFVQYNQYLSDPVPVILCGSKSLRHGYYELRKYRKIIKDAKRFIPIINIEIEKEVEEEVDIKIKNQCDSIETETTKILDLSPEIKQEPIEEKDIKDIAENRSISNKKVKRKVRRKRQPVKAKKETLDDA